MTQCGDVNLDLAIMYNCIIFVRNSEAVRLKDMGMIIFILLATVFLAYSNGANDNFI